MNSLEASVYRVAMAYDISDRALCEYALAHIEFRHRALLDQAHELPLHPHDVRLDNLLVMIASAGSGAEFLQYLDRATNPAYR
jgi:hypothetical protein